MKHSCWLAERDRVKRTTSILLALMAQLPLNNESSSRNCIAVWFSFAHGFMFRAPHMFTDVGGPVHLSPLWDWEKAQIHRTSTSSLTEVKWKKTAQKINKLEAHHTPSTKKNSLVYKRSFSTSLSHQLGPSCRNHLHRALDQHCPQRRPEPSNVPDRNFGSRHHVLGGKWPRTCTFFKHGMTMNDLTPRSSLISICLYTHCIRASAHHPLNHTACWALSQVRHKWQNCRSLARSKLVQAPWDDETQQKKWL